MCYRCGDTDTWQNQSNASTRPVWVPPNLKFIVDDVEDEWLHGDDWDFVHLRCLSPWLKDEPKLLRAAFE